MPMTSASVSQKKINKVYMEIRIMDSNSKTDDSSNYSIINECDKSYLETLHFQPWYKVLSF